MQAIRAGRGRAGGVLSALAWGLLVHCCVCSPPLAATFCRPGFHAACSVASRRRAAGGTGWFRTPRALTLRGGAWISEEVADDATDRAEGKESPPTGPAGLQPAGLQAAADGLAAEDTALDDFVERCAAAVKKGGGEGLVPTDMPYEDFVWTKEFAEQGFDPLFMLGMTEEQAEIARKEWVSRIMDGEDDVDQLCEHYKDEGNKLVNEARKLKTQGNENHTKLHAAAIRLYTDALCQNCSSLVLRAVCHANRANSHLERSNFGHALRDCNATLAIYDAVAKSPGGAAVWVGGQEARGAVEEEEDSIQLQRVASKSAARAACACLRLNRYEAAIHFCRRALDLHLWGNISSGGRRGGGGGSGGVGGGKTGKEGRVGREDCGVGGVLDGGGGFVRSVKRMWEEADAALAVRAAVLKRAKKAKEAAKKKVFEVKDALKRRGVILGASLYPRSLLTLLRSLFDTKQVSL